MPADADITKILLRWSGGDSGALDELTPLVYDHLKRLAHARLRGERPGHTLNTTGLVHEAYLKLIDIDRVQWTDRAHFLAMASRVMRRVLIGYAERRKAKKRGGGIPNVVFDEERVLMPDAQAETLLELDDALRRMEAGHPRQAQAMELYYFGGLTQREVGDVLGVSQQTVAEDVRFAQAWLAHLWED